MIQYKEKEDGMGNVIGICYILIDHSYKINETSNLFV